MLPQAYSVQLNKLTAKPLERGKTGDLLPPLKKNIKGFALQFVFKVYKGDQIVRPHLVQREYTSCFIKSTYLFHHYVRIINRKLTQIILKKTT